MRTQYTFDADTAELREMTVAEGCVVTRTVYSRLGPVELCHMFVDEGDDAEREFFGYFGDDSSWPPGWYAALVAPKIHRLRTGTYRYNSSNWRPITAPIAPFTEMRRPW